jgi:hypothetical protein
MWVRVKVIRAVGSDDSKFLVRFKYCLSTKANYFQVMMILGTVCEGRSSPWALLTKGLAKYSPSVYPLLQ